MRRIVLFTVLLVFLASCASRGERASLPPSFKMLQVKREVKEYINEGALRVRKGGDRFSGGGMVDKFRYGDIMLPPDKKGEEYVIRWKAKTGGELADPVTLRFEYVYTNAEPPSRTDKLYRDVESGRFRYAWHNIGSNYTKNGRVVSWRCSLRYRGEEVDHIQSALWQ